MDYNHFYAYAWHVDEEYQDDTYIRIYGFNEGNENICVSINGFRPFVWVELPTFVDWKLRGNQENLEQHFRGLFPGIRCSVKFRKKLYGATLARKKNGKFARKLFPFLLCSFASFKDAKFNLVNKLKSKQYINGLGALKFSVHGQDACPRLQLTSKYDLPTVGWIKFKGVEILDEHEKFTFGTREYMVSLNSGQFKPSELISRSDKTTVPKPLILSFDLEVNSEDQMTMPKATRPGDVIFQISCVFSRLGTQKYDKYLLSLGNPVESIVNATILAFSTEKKLLMAFRDLINQHNPNVIIGYNIFNFDIPYLMDRANHKSIYPEWSQQGFAKEKSGVAREIKWSSSAYKNQEFKFLDCEGRLYIDLLPVVQRDFKLNDYKLKTVSAHFLGETKDDLDPKSIFRCYVEGMKEGNEASQYMSICGKYCMQDSMLVMKLLEKLNVWYGLLEMAVVCNVPIIVLFTKGQQIKVYSMLYKYCLENQIVPEKDGYAVSENERYVGAYVFAPTPGLYENVVPLDFSQLYPSLIIAYNIDYTTCVFDPAIPDELCHVMEWDDHIGCKHDSKVVEKARLTKLIDELTSKKNHDKQLVSDFRKQRSEITKSINKNVMCETRKYRFLKVSDEYPEFKGVLPSIIQSLLDARKHTREKMAMLKEDLKNVTSLTHQKEIEATISILNQRQLAYKVSANSMYGITGVKAGMLPFMPVAMSITYMGRVNIMKVANVVENMYDGKIVAGDTDSNYVSFKHAGFSVTQLWDHAIKVAAEISAIFPPPMKLEFEEAIYTKFLILTKKRYMYKTALRDGVIKPEIGKRGVLLNRRDNSAFIRDTYENVIRLIFEYDRGEAGNRGVEEGLKEKIIQSLKHDIQMMFSDNLPIEHFVITKSTGDYGNLQPQYFQNEKGVHRAMLGQYNVPFLTEEVKLEEGIETAVQERNWYSDKLPAHIQLLEKLKRRGQLNNEGGRLEYVIIETRDLKAKQCMKIETLNYFKKHQDVLKLDYLYYLSRLINPVDQVLEVVFQIKDFMKNQYNYQVLKKKMSRQIEDLFAPKFNIETDRLYVMELDGKYKLIHGHKKQCKKTIRNTMDDWNIVLKLDYTPFLPQSSSATSDNMYAYLKNKYGVRTTLKTQFVFQDGYILLGNMTHAKLLSTIKKELKCSKTQLQKLF